MNGNVALEKSLECLDHIGRTLSAIDAGSYGKPDDQIGQLFVSMQYLSDNAETLGLPQVKAATADMQDILVKVLGHELSLTQSLKDAFFSLLIQLKQFINERFAAAGTKETISHPAITTAFCNLARKYKTDKAPGVADHSYTLVYDELFGSKRHAIQAVLEIGIGPTIYRNPRRVIAGQPPDPLDPNLVQICGASLRTLAAFFPKARVYGIDIFEGLLIEAERIKTFLCDQSDRAQLRQMASAFGPFDIIIDDGSHLEEHQIISFFTLMEFVRPGGYYLIEDVAVKDLFLDPFYNPSKNIRRLIEPTVLEAVLRQVRYCANYSLNGTCFGYSNPRDDHLIVVRKMG